MKEYDLYGIGNALVDVVIGITDQRLNDFGYERGTTTLVSADQQKRLLEELAGEHQELVSGGSVANSVIAAASLGSKCIFGTKLGLDQLGAHYEQEFQHLGVLLDANKTNELDTGSCVSLTSPGGERTMRTYLGASQSLAPEDLDFNLFLKSAWVFVEGYLIGNPEVGPKLVHEIIAAARKAGCRIALTTSAPFVVEAFREIVEELLPQVDLLFANETEAALLTGESEPELAVAKLSRRGRWVVVTAGAQGSWLDCGAGLVHCSAVACEPIDLTGAGDMFAGSFLHGCQQGLPPLTAAHGAAAMASKVICQIGARLKSSELQTWQSAIS